jgi:hypothetical protein
MTDYSGHTQPFVDETIDGIELLYKNRDLHENAHLAIRGKHIREIIVELESAKRCNQPIFAQLIKMGIKGIVLDNGKGGYVYALFVAE